MCGRFTQKLTWRQIHDLYSLTGPGATTESGTSLQRRSGAGFRGLPP